MKNQSNELIKFMFKNANSTFLSSLKSIHTLNQIFPLMYDAYLKLKVEELGKNLGINNPDLYLYDLVGIIAERRITNRERNLDEFSGFENANSISL